MRSPRPRRDGTIHRHLGFLVRPYIGFGYLSGSSGDVTISGLGGQLGVVLGGALQENLILGGELGGTAVNEPKVSQGGFSGTASDTTFGDVGINDAAARINTWGAGVVFSATYN